MTTISLRKASPAKTRADALVVGVVQTDDGPQVAAGGADVAAGFGRSFPRTLTTLGVKGTLGETTRLAGAGAVKADLVTLVGLGRADDLTTESLRRAVGSAVRGLAGTSTVAIAVPADTAEQVGAVAEGVLLGAYAYHRYFTQKVSAPVEEVTVLTGLARSRAAKAEVERAQTVAAAVNTARSWVNTPPGDLTPELFADDLVRRAKSTGVKVEVLDEKQLESQGYGGIMGVGRGSANPPRLVKMSYRPRKPAAHLSFAGKGITFDSGGISLKISASMYTMKCDMGGAAAVAAAILAVADLDLPVQVTAYAALAENMPSGTAARPGDVMTMYGGKTVEVLNTDAEGRLVLADALTAASALEPDVLVDVATLTGACVIALGHRTSAIMANDEQLQRTIHATAEQVGETMWPLPLPEEMYEKVHGSKVADLAQIQTDKAGGALYAGAFLREFVGDGIPWAHLDIAGTAFNSGSPYGYTPEGGTGAAVRTLVRLAADRARR